MKGDSYTIQEGTESDASRIADFFEQQKFILGEEKLVRWKYFSNPAGPPRIFMVTGSNPEPLGILTFMPREFRMPSGETIMLMQAVDAFFSRELRGKGMYRELIDHSKQVVAEPVYTFPNKLAENAEKKAGWKLYSEIDSWYFPVNIGQRLDGRLAQYYRPFANLVSRGYSWVRLGGFRDHVKIARVEKFERDFEAPGDHAAGSRSADYLNWRFIDNPLREYQCYEFFEAGECIGFCAITYRNSMVELYDFVASKSQRQCLRKIVEICRKNSIEYLFCRAVGLDFSNLGFVKRKSLSNLIVYNLPELHWSLMACDSDWD